MRRTACFSGSRHSYGCGTRPRACLSLPGPPFFSALGVPLGRPPWRLWRRRSLPIPERMHLSVIRFADDEEGARLTERCQPADGHSRIADAQVNTTRSALRDAGDRCAPQVIFEAELTVRFWPIVENLPNPRGWLAVGVLFVIDGGTHHAGLEHGSRSAVLRIQPRRSRPARSPASRR